MSINMDFRPSTYFPLVLAESKPKQSAKLTAAERKALESIHPTFMGGNYLPKLSPGEVEIARIRIQSTTSDVTCVYAIAVGGQIHYRTVDEYEGETLTKSTTAVTSSAMSLQELIDFFFEAWPFLQVLESNSEGDLQEALDFFSCESEFYPDFYQACQQVVIERFPDSDEEVGDGDTCPHCGKFNSVPAADTCEHLVGCRWDGQLDIVGGPRDLKAHWDALVEEAAAREDDIAKDVILQVEANKSPALARLIDAAGKGAELFEVLTEIYEVDCGGGWSTGGMLGGSGFNLYTEDLKTIKELDGICVNLVQDCTQISAQADGPSILDLPPRDSDQWQLAASGYWEEGTYHSGHIAYSVAKYAPDAWVMVGLSRNTLLDDVEEEDVEEGRLNDDQIQAMWGLTLEEAKNQEYREVVASCKGVPSHLGARDVAKILYRIVCDNDGKEISEFDRSSALLSDHQDTN